jgi:diaminopimelate epimerase
MGKISFDSVQIPVTGKPREVIQEEIKIDEEVLEFTAATIGNPHCVILCNDISEAQTTKLGPKIETDNRFPNRTNVQFMKVLDRSNIKIEIWERGAGYTLSSGSSSCAAAAVAHRLDLCDSETKVYMPGGQINVLVLDDYSIIMTGSVTKVAEGVISKEMFI